MILSNIGMPVMGRNGETKKALESFRNEKIGVAELLSVLKEVRKKNYSMQNRYKVELIPVFDTDPYDRLLRHAVMFGTIPSRFGNLKEIATDLSKYFFIPRGSSKIQAAQMTKWFNTNYDTVKPEIEGDFQLNKNFVINHVKEAVGWGYRTKVALIGPLTFLHYSTIKSKKTFEELFHLITPLYKEIVSTLSDEEIEFIQIEEPVLVFDHAKEYLELLKTFFESIAPITNNTKIILQTYFGSISHILNELVKLPVSGIGLDLADEEKNFQSIMELEWPQDLWLACGIVSGRSPWITDLRENFDKLSSIAEKVSFQKLILQPSCSLMHLPYTIADESELSEEIKSYLAFGLERLEELYILGEGLKKGEHVIKDNILQNSEILKRKRFNIKLHSPA